MARLYFKKLLWFPVYIIAYFLVINIIYAFLGMFLGPGILSILSILSIAAFVALMTSRKRLNNGDDRRKYLGGFQENADFSWLNEVRSIIRTPQFKAEFMAFATFNAILVIISAADIDKSRIPVFVIGVLISICFFTIFFSVIDIAIWLGVRYKWYSGSFAKGNKKKERGILKFFHALHMLIYIFPNIRMLIKRRSFVSKLKKISQNNRYQIDILSHWHSLYKRDASPDIILTTDVKKYRIYLFPSAIKRARYHFSNDGLVYVFKIKRKNMHMYSMHFPARAIVSQRAFFSQDMQFKLEDNYIFKMKDFEIPDKTAEQDERRSFENIVITCPVPMIVTAIDGSVVCSLGDGDFIRDNVRFYSGNGFRNMLTAEQDAR